ncbi:hypothetical protein [Euzebya rosea]|uniref:hypothetical protein n=1 Tax=Euzebya rosea TaxID=2052804 RepID=UPI0013006825|nr:hypothetical protein [Euzebya rosea]
MATVTYEWAHPVATEGPQARWIPGVLGGIGTAVGLATAITGDVVAGVVILVLVVGYVLLAERRLARAVAFRIRVWDNGALEIANGESSWYPVGELTDVQVGVAGAGEHGVRTLRLQHRGGEVPVSLPGGIGYLFNGPSLTTTHTGQLVDALRHFAGLPARSAVGPPVLGQQPPGQAAAPVVGRPSAGQPFAGQPSAGQPSAGVPAVGDQPNQSSWTWQHPEADDLVRRRNRFVTISAVVVVVLMVVAGASQRDAGIGAVLLSAAVAPGLLGLLLFAVAWVGWIRPTRFRLEVDGDGVLRRGTSTVRLTGASEVSVDLVSSSTHTGTTTVRSRSWVLRVTPATGKPWSTLLPGGSLGGRLLTEQEAEHLAQQLRWFAGLPSWWS